MTADTASEIVAKAERIKDALRSCETVQQVNHCVRDIASAHRELRAAGDLGRQLAIHIENLARYKRKHAR